MVTTANTAVATHIRAQRPRCWGERTGLFDRHLGGPREPLGDGAGRTVEVRELAAQP